MPFAMLQTVVSQTSLWCLFNLLSYHCRNKCLFFHFNPILCKNVLSLLLAVQSIKCQERDNNLKWLILLRVHSSNWRINFSALNCGIQHPSVPGPATRGAFVGLAPPPQTSYCVPLPLLSPLCWMWLIWKVKKQLHAFADCTLPTQNTTQRDLYPPPPICSIKICSIPNAVYQILPLALYINYNLLRTVVYV